MKSGRKQSSLKQRGLNLLLGGSAIFMLQAASPVILQGLTSGDQFSSLPGQVHAAEEAEKIILQGIVM